MSKKSPVDSDNYYAYPAWFEGGNQSQPSTSSYSYPTLEYIWSNAVRLTRTTHSNLQDEIEYIEANLGSGGNESCNCSALQFGIDSNTTKIENLSTIKLSRDGSQSMTGLLKCESGLETNTIAPYSGNIIECTDNLKVNGDVVGDSTDGLNLVAEDTNIASRIQLTPGSNSKILLGTFSGQSVIPRVEIPEGSGNVSITIRGAHLIPYTDNDQNLGSSSKRWKEIYAVKGNFSGIVIPDNLINIGPYSVIVYKDDTGVYAKDPSGNMIAQGNAGTDDATVVKTAFEYGGRVVIMPATYTLYFTVTGSTFLITLPDYTVVDGLVPDKTKLEFYIDGSTPASGQHYNVMEIRTGSNCGVMNLTINGNKSYFAPKNYLQYLIYSVNKSNVLIENVNLYHSSRCGIVPESKYMKIRNVYAEDCRMPMNAITMEELEIDGYTAKTCDYAVYIEAGGGTNVILRNFYFSDCLRGVQSYGDLTNVVIKEGTIELKDSYDARGIVAQESNKELTIKNVRLPTVPHGFAFVVDGVGLGDAVISNCYCSGYNGFWAHNCIIDGGYYKASYLFTSYSNNLLVKNANLYTTYRMFYNHASKIHLENCILNSRASDGTTSDITYRRCFIGDAPTENSSTAIFSGDGNKTQFIINHDLVGKPHEVLITPRSQDAAGNFYATCNGSQITVHYLSPPPSGTDNVELSWKASM